MNDTQDGTGAYPDVKCMHPEAEGERYGDPITATREVELQKCLKQWAEEDQEGRKGPCDDVPLTGADVYWLAAKLPKAYGYVPHLNLRGTRLILAHLEGARLGGSHLEGAILAEAHLEGAILRGAHL